MEKDLFQAVVSFRFPWNERGFGACGLTPLASHHDRQNHPQRSLSLDAAIQLLAGFLEPQYLDLGFKTGFEVFFFPRKNSSMSSGPL